MNPVLILDYPGALQSAALGLRDLLSFAGLRPEIVSNPTHSAASAIILPPAANMSDPYAYPDLLNWLVDCGSKDILICSACVGVTWAAAAKLDAGRTVTTHWGIEAVLRKDWPELSVDTDRLVIEYSDLVTAGGMMAWVDLALIVIERLAGREKMLTTARHFVVDPDRRDQRRFQRFQPVTDHGDGKVLKIQRLMEKEVQLGSSVPDLARSVGLSPRTLQRRFSSATGLALTQYLQKLRVERAKSLLADSQLSVAEIALQTGYSDVPAFYRVFQRLAGMTPAAFRKTVRADAANRAG